MSKFSSPNINDFVNNQITSYNKIPEEDLNFEPFTEQEIDPIARIAAQTYQDTDKRQDIGNYKYLQDESTDDLAVYENNDEYHISVRGTSSKTPVRDFVADVGISLGTVGSALLPGAFYEDIDNLQNKINKFKLKKPVHVSGHSKGGTIAGFVGVDNPDVRVTTFNRGDALPFVGDYIKCAINGCDNINNYRISGDVVGLIGSKFSNQRYFNLRPKKPTKEMKETAESIDFTLENIQRAGVGFPSDVESKYYLPHPIENFYNRKESNLLNDDTYSRPLASKLGKYGVIAGAAAATYGYKKYLEFRKRTGRITDEEFLETAYTGMDMLRNNQDILEDRILDQRLEFLPDYETRPLPPLPGSQQPFQSLLEPEPPGERFASIEQEGQFEDFQQNLFINKPLKKFSNYVEQLRTTPIANIVGGPYGQIIGGIIGGATIGPFVGETVYDAVYGKDSNKNGEDEL